MIYRARGFLRLESEEQMERLPIESLESAIGVQEMAIEAVFDKAILEFLKELKEYRAIGTVEEFKALKEYKEKMEMQYIDDMENPLEPLKLSSALQSEIFKYNYRKEHKPQDINTLDYTVMYALKHCLEEQLKGGVE